MTGERRLPRCAMFLEDPLRGNDEGVQVFDEDRNRLPGKKYLHNRKCAEALVAPANRIVETKRYPTYTEQMVTGVS